MCTCVSLFDYFRVEYLVRSRFFFFTFPPCAKSWRPFCAALSRRLKSVTALAWRRSRHRTVSSAVAVDVIVMRNVWAHRIKIQKMWVMPVIFDYFTHSFVSIEEVKSSTTHAWRITIKRLDNDYLYIYLLGVLSYNNKFVKNWNRKTLYCFNAKYVQTVMPNCTRHTTFL